MTYFGFAISDSMFSGDCEVTRKVKTAEEVKEELMSTDISYCLNPSHKPTIDAAKERYDLNLSIPETAPKVSLTKGDSIIIMQVQGLPRLNAERHEYTQEEISKATFTFSKWDVK